MRRLAHLSDLHFGRTDAKVVEALVADLARSAPDLVVVSGDLTQRARSWQFAEARAFLARMPAPAVIVPGNHDLAPLYRPFSRLFSPRAKFHSHLPGHDSWPVWTDEELAVIGLDSTRATRWKSGKLRGSHLDHVDSVLAGVSDKACRVAFLHHPPHTARAGHPFAELARRGIDLVLSGHAHRTHVELIAADERSAILVQSSTACSTRLREDANGYSLVEIALPRLSVTVRGWTGEIFHPVHAHSFEKRDGHWHPVHSPST